MLLPDDTLIEILAKNGVLTKKKAEHTRDKAIRGGQSLYRALVTQNVIDREKLGQLVARKYEVEYTNLDDYQISDEMKELVPSLVAYRHFAVAFYKDEKGIHLGVNNPGDKRLIDNFQKRADAPVVVYFVDELSFDHVFKQFEGSHTDFEQSVLELMEKGRDVSKAEDLPVIKVVDELLNYGYVSKASDIHIEPYDEKSVIRCRIDGILHDIATIPPQFHHLIVARIKILSRLRTDEHQASQDGKLRFKDKSGDKVDVRVSLVPVVYGEKVVMRILSEKARQYDLDSLGFGKVELEKMHNHIDKPWGMILATGPTGSGKTTTLYSILKILNTREVNISTIEDPVEYDLEGVNQIQVNSKTGLSFASGLRAIVRQDPDIIMVGEIRDEETAKIAVNSAMTGHLVLSTLHTNDAGTSIPRLMDMGIEPFLVTSTVNVIIAQRLVRRMCEKCVKKAPVSKETLQLISEHLSKGIIDKFKLNDPKLQIAAAVGCEECKTGYKGRVGIYEVLEMNEEIKKLIMSQANATQIEAAAVAQGMTTMIEDGISKVLQGQTTVEEILRVAKE